jgi:hypothetical protein
VALVEGGTESNQQKLDAMAFMKDLADATGGVFRGFGPLRPVARSVKAGGVYRGFGP